MGCFVKFNDLPSGNDCDSLRTGSHGPFIAFIVDVPNLKMVIFHSKLLVYQRVTQELPKEKPLL